MGNTHQVEAFSTKCTLLCDPSHISGNTHMIAEVSQTAMDLNMDGLMIETHYRPSKALSDATTNHAQSAY